MMTERHKILLLTLVPTLLSLLLVSVFVQYQSRSLFKEQSSFFNQTILDIRKNELVNYSQLARSAIAHVYEDPSIEIDEKHIQAKKILNNLEYSNDGYFYVYSNKGDSIVHPKQPYRLGENWWDLTDSEGKPIIQELISQAEAGGGYTEYLWEQPSSGAVGKKLGYSEMINDWDWMFGTGIYIDDIEKQITKIDEVFDDQIRSTSLIIMTIAAIAVASVFGIGQFFQFFERKHADSKLQQLSKRVINTQDEERRRVSRELHDSISQRLVAIKYSLEEAHDSEFNTQEENKDRIKVCESHIDETLAEVRRISHDLHPSILDDLGLMSAVQALVDQFSARTNIDVVLTKTPFRNLLPTDAKTALYRIVQEALTNIERHAQATTVSIVFEIKDKWYLLNILDNGIGFDTDLSNRGEAGLGLRNMSERMSYYNGIFEIKSSSQGTDLSAGIPKKTLSINNQFASSQS